DILQAMAEGKGPANALVTLGCAGWGAGQLEQELADNDWLTAPPDTELLFRLPLEARWEAAAGRIGVDFAHLAVYSGRA
ncbi:MAG TPA: YqgE/AlgH family protein, partial [Lysobacter sp.]|nr:YqgE/AlgH family protein [Lysobacter sp.]